MRGGYLNIGEKAQEVAQERIAGTDIEKPHGRRIAHRQIGSIVRGKVVVDFQPRGQGPRQSSLKRIDQNPPTVGFDID